MLLKKKNLYYICDIIGAIEKDKHDLFFQKKKT